MLHHVHTCIAIFFTISANPFNIHPQHKPEQLLTMFHQNPYTVETLTDHAQKNIRIISNFTKCLLTTCSL